MSDFEDRLSANAGRIAARWDSERSARTAHAMRRTRRRRAVVRVASGAALALLAVFSGLWWTGRVVTLSDGSTAQRATGETELVERSQTASLLEVELLRGRARFSVRKDPRRVFRVLAGRTVVEVLGTVFTVDRGPRGERVSVEEGRVKVLAAGREVVLEPGQSEQFEATAQPPGRQVEAQAPAPDPQPTPTTQPPAPSQVQSPTRHGGARPAADTDEVATLLAAAEQARLAGHPAQAVPALRRVVGRFPRDARAQGAALSLGHLLLDELARPADAAEAFATARRLDPSGPFAEDALANEVEAWMRAAQPERARAAADLYLSTYPHGARRQGVQRAVK